jgi:hypothetical protein
MKPQPLRTYRLLTLLTLISLGGCAIVAQQYPSPAGTEVAFLRVIEQGKKSLPQQTSVFTFEKSATCEGRMWIYNETRAGKEHVMPNGFVSIEAGNPFSLMVVTTIGTTHEWNKIITNFCGPAVNFVPIAGRHYVAEEYHAGGQCFLRLLSAEAQSMENSRTETVKKMRFTRGFDESSSWCKSE